ncbi:GatB/YqeY domain-containing protein [Alkalilacustris brevis]|uniref:GatB/YqeY domain-containing protein n=1 Tax=Alkalilacustris brevis TaxID=2026338 RepID=UPI000E0CCA44|nr:GatB/YqeY domain-containing protein [Alkalilacustris brevis]
MELQARIAQAVREAEADGDSLRLSTLRLIQAAIRDRDLALRARGVETGPEEDELRATLSRMAAQRRDIAQAYEEAARLKQAEAKLQEAAIIEEFLPRAMSDSEAEAAIEAALSELDGTPSIRDLGRVLAVLRARHAGRMDFGEARRRVRSRLS